MLQKSSMGCWPFGRSTHGWLANLWWAKKGIFSFTFAPIEILGYAAATLTGVSFVVLACQVIALWRRAAPLGLSTLASLIVFFGSLNLLAIAMLGEYLIKIFQETKRRPRFIRKAVRHGGEVLTASGQIEAFVQRRARDNRKSDGG